MQKRAWRAKETTRFLKWVKKYSGWWYLICTPNEGHMNIEMMKMLIKQLANEGFYEMIFVLLMVHRNADFMAHLNDYMTLSVLIKNWKSGYKHFFREIIDFLE